MQKIFYILFIGFYGQLLATDAEPKFSNLCDCIDIDRMSNSKEPAPENMIRVESQDKQIFLYGGISFLKNIIDLPKELPLFQYLAPDGPEQIFEEIIPPNKEEPSIPETQEKELNANGFYLLTDGADLEVVYRTFPENAPQGKQNSQKVSFFMGKIENGHFKPSLFIFKPSQNNDRFIISPNGKYLLFLRYGLIKIYRIHAANDSIFLIPFYHAYLPNDYPTALYGGHLTINEQGAITVTWKNNTKIKTYFCDPLNKLPFRERILFELLVGCFKSTNKKKKDDLINLTNFIVEHNLIHNDLFNCLKDHMAVKLHILTILEKISKQSFIKRDYFGISYSPICPMNPYISKLTNGKDDEIKSLIWKIALTFYGSGHKTFYDIKLTDQQWKLLSGSFNDETICELMNKFGLDRRKISL